MTLNMCQKSDNFVQFHFVFSICHFNLLITFRFRKLRLGDVSSKDIRLVIRLSSVACGGFALGFPFSFEGPVGVAACFLDLLGGGDASLSLLRSL